MRDFKVSKIELKGLLDLAKESLGEAKSDLNEGFIRGAISSSYYCFLHSMRAALLQNGVIAKSHKGVKDKFNEEFIKTGKFDKKFGAIISNLFEERLDADYEPLQKFTREQAKDAIEQAKEFLDKVEGFLD